jgi:hypothetical protein
MERFTGKIALPAARRVLRRCRQRNPFRELCGVRVLTWRRGRESNTPATAIAARPVLKPGGTTGPLPPPQTLRFTGAGNPAWIGSAVANCGADRGGRHSQSLPIRYIGPGLLAPREWHRGPRIRFVDGLDIGLGFFRGAALADMMGVGYPGVAGGFFLDLRLAADDGWAGGPRSGGRPIPSSRSTEISSYRRSTTRSSISFIGHQIPASASGSVRVNASSILFA